MGMSMKVARRATSVAVASAAMGAVLMTPETASAQVQVQGGVGVSVGATAYAPPPPVVYQQPQVVYQQPGLVYQRPMVLAQPMTRRGNVGRFRYGIDAGAGWQFMDFASGFNLNASMRLGWQINDQMAVFYQTDLPIGFVAGRRTGGSVDVAGASVIWGNAVMFEYTLNDFVSFSLGPSADVGLGAVCGSGGSSDCIGAAGTFFGIQSRISFNLMPGVESNPYRRAGFRLGLGGHTTFMGGVVVQSLSILLGWELM